ncbi:MAG: hypothetical protein AAF387_19320 [Pseudomonadota bacterium]
MFKRFTSIVLLSSFASTGTAIDITTNEIDRRRFEITIRSSKVLDERVAQSKTLLPALDACEPLYPKFESYTFDSSQKLNLDSSEENNTTFVFTQTVSCHDDPASSREPTHEPIVQESKLSDEELESITRANTISYITNKLAGNPKLAYEQLGEEALIHKNYADWLQSITPLRDSIGDIVALDINKITIYRNRGDAPRQGTYVAADFFNRYSKIPIHCGYLVWFQNASGAFEITREDSGTIPQEVVDQISPDQLDEILGQFGCVSR